MAIDTGATTKSDQPLSGAARVGGVTWVFGTILGTASVISLITRMFNVGLAPVFEDFAAWWRAYTHPPLSALYSIIQNVAPGLHIPPWLHDYHIFSLVGAAMYSRTLRPSLPRSTELGARIGGMLQHALLVMCYTLVLGLSGIGALFLLTGIAVLIKPSSAGVHYRDLFESRESSPALMIGLLRATVFSLIGIMIFFATNYYAPK